MFINTKMGAFLAFCFYITSMPLLSDTSATKYWHGSEKGMNNRALPPGTCPPGFRPATHPLNPALGCLPNNFYLPVNPDGLPDIPEGMCPEGWRPVTQPLNPMLVCLPDQLTSPGSNGIDHRWWQRDRHSVCPTAWVLVTKRQHKQALICLPRRIAKSLPAAPPPGECPEGWRPATPPLNPVLGCLPNTLVMPGNPNDDW